MPDVFAFIVTKSCGCWLAFLVSFDVCAISRALSDHKDRTSVLWWPSLSCIVLSGDVTMFLALVELLSLVLFRAPALSLCKRMAVPFAVDVIIGRSSSVCSCIGTSKTEGSSLSTYRLVNLSRVPWDLDPSEASDQIEWRVKDLQTYLVHGLHKKLNSLCVYLIHKILFKPKSYHQFNFNDR